MEYLDFELEVTSADGHRYQVIVSRSPAGVGRETISFPFGELELELWLERLQNALLRSGGRRRRILSPEAQHVQEFGRALFEALFTGEISNLYSLSRREAAQEGKGLRLKLRLQPPEMAFLPWEFLFDPHQDEYITLSRDTSIVRYPAIPRPVKPQPFIPPLHILAMLASPQELPLLDGDRERQRISVALTNARAEGLVSVTWVQGQRWRDLQRALRHGPPHAAPGPRQGWHVFHFIGHGGFDRVTEEGFIALADQEGMLHRFNATRLARMLQGYSSLRLVVLNACEGATGNQQDLFSSTAATLIRRGLPAVLAMQHEITDSAAIELARTFYEVLAEGSPVDEALAETRKAISFTTANTFEWGTPVLYLGATDGRLFDLEEPLPVPSGRPVPSPSPVPGIAAELHRRLQQTLSIMEAFTSHRALRALFVDERLAPWRDQFPQTDSVSGRVQAVIDFLYVRENAAGDNGLVLLLQVLQDRLDPADGLYRRLGVLAAELAGRPVPPTAKQQAGQLRQAIAQALAENDVVTAEKMLPEWRKITPDDPEIEPLAKQLTLLPHYLALVQAMEDRDWTTALSLADNIFAADPNFRDVATLRTIAQQEHDQSQKQIQATEWQTKAEAALARDDVLAAENAFRQWRQVTPDSAEVKIFAQRLSLRHHYLALVRTAEEQDWTTAFSLADSIYATDPYYRDVKELRARAKHALAQADKQETALFDVILKETGPMKIEVMKALRPLTGLGYVEVKKIAENTPQTVLVAGNRETAEKAQAQLTAAGAVVEIKISYRQSGRGDAERLLGSKEEIGEQKSPDTPITHTIAGIEFIEIPAGEFWMGDNLGKQNEIPAHKVYLDAYRISRTPLTNAQYREFVVATGHDIPRHWTKAGRQNTITIPKHKANHPVVNVSWEDAQAFCRWLSTRTGVRITLPTEAQWEKAARGPGRLVYPWGNKFDLRHCNVKDSGIGDTTPVEKYPHGISPYGVLDMCGNVYEWVQDWYDDEYYTKSPKDNPHGPSNGSTKVLRGGCWQASKNLVRTSSRNFRDPTYRYYYIGFRCVQEI